MSSKFWIWVVSLLQLTSQCYTADVSDTTVVMVQLMVRHGVRSVLQNYPNEPTPISYWNQYGGTGQLTTVGMRQLNSFGKFIKNYYSSFWNSTYDRSKVYVRSTDYDRTLQSAYSFLSGAYQPNSAQTWSSDSGLSAYMPIPVHTTNLQNDTILHANAPCPRYSDLRTQMRSSTEWLNLQDKYNSFLQNMSAYSGLNLTNNLYHIWEIADNALVDEAHGISLPQWVIDNYQNIMDTNDLTFYIDFVTIEMGKLISGGLLNEIVNNIKSKVSGSAREFYLYTVHDNYVAGMQKLLNTSTLFLQPHFASGFVFELRVDTNKNYYVRVLNKTNKYPEPDALNPVQIYGCDLLCPLQTFYSLTADKLVTDFTAPCASQASSRRIGFGNGYQEWFILLTFNLIGIIFLYSNWNLT